ncbi:hypothetical protein Aple_066510 [Acrocarpospora pleiomorpha]|uniref:Uncharacterized protein n=1 Tax=Acrocarpospora pleiomorpha TaxID=90975 RepID=A0A5M3XRS6_9ACTN|nr:hypothetical protein Aple_066510 [Acrocarpospora pleiomorpha]
MAEGRATPREALKGYELDGWHYRQAQGYQVRERRQSQAVGWFIPHPWDLAAKDRVLMPKHQQFRLFGDVAP